MILLDNFVNIAFSKLNLDRYIVRTSILKALNDNISLLNGSFLDIGCGKMPYRDYIMANTKVVEYVGLDIDSALEYDRQVKPDLYWNGTKMPIKDNSFNSAMATEVMEHVPNPAVFLEEVFRVLKQDGVFFFTVPFLWPLHETPHDEYRYTPFALERLLRETGFRDVKIKATGGWHKSMAQMLGLWVIRSPYPKNRKKILANILKPIIKYLIKIDRVPDSFKEGQMITGLSGVAIK